MRPLAEIIVHCSATRPEWYAGRPVVEAVEEIRRWHVDDRGWADIGYHFVVDRAGNTGIGRPLARTGAHTRGHNAGTIGICLLGGHGSSADDRFVDNFTAAQDAELRRLIAVLKKDHRTIQVISGHNQYANKSCPGFRVDKWLAMGPIAPLAVEIPAVTGWLRVRAFFRNLFN